MVFETGLEPALSSSGGKRFIQLNYSNKKEELTITNSTIFLGKTFPVI